MKTAVGYLLSLGVAIGPPAIAQTGSHAANPTSAATESDVVILSIASADKVPPPVCLKALAAAAKLASDNNVQPLIDFLSYNTDQLCNIYLMLSSRQFIAANTYSHGALLPFAEKSVESEAIKDLKAYAQQNGSSLRNRRLHQRDV